MKNMKRTGGVNSSGVAKPALEEAAMRKEMLGAAQAMDRLREATKTSGLSGVREIRKWRDADRKS